MQNVKRSFLAALPFIAACAGIDVRTDYDSATDFSVYKTYSWATHPTAPNPILADHIVAVIDAQLAASGWQKVTEGDGNVAINANVATEKRKQSGTMSTATPGDWFGAAGGWAGSTDLPTYTAGDYSDGTLIINIFDTKTNKKIWSGTAGLALTNDNAGNQREINAAAQKMFSGFPPAKAEGSLPK